jgi:hypothetical protein
MNQSLVGMLFQCRLRSLDQHQQLKLFLEFIDRVVIEPA